MTVSFDTFDRLKTKGLAAYNGGEYLAAKTYLVEAVECLLELAGAAKSADARRQHEEVAAELIQLAKECDRLHTGGRRGKPGAHGGRGPGGTAKRGIGCGNAAKGGAGRQAAESDDDDTDASDWVIREKPKIGFDDIAGLEDIKEDIRLKMLYPFAHPELAQKYGISVGGGVLLYGPPGTGKTMIAKAVAREIDATFFLISPAQMLSKWVGEAEQNVRKLFDAAKAEPVAVIFLDEAEALVPKRQSEGTSVMQRVVPQILQELEGFDRKGDRALLFMAATNQPWLLDEAMLRPGRLDTKVYIGLPDAPAIVKLLELSFEGRPLDDDVDFGELCDRLNGYSGADIKSIAQQSAQRPFLEAIAGQAARKINQADILTVIEETPPSVHPSALVRFEEFARAWK